MRTIFLSSVSTTSRSSGRLHENSLLTLGSGLENLKCLSLIRLCQNICLG